MQEIASTLIVAACAGYAVWALLLPAAWRGRVRQALKLKPPDGCAGRDGCGGCGGDTAPARPAAPQVVRWMPRRRG